MMEFGLELNEYNELMDKLLAVTDLRAKGSDQQAWALFDVIIAEQQLLISQKWQTLVDFNALSKDVVF